MKWYWKVAGAEDPDGKVIDKILDWPGDWEECATNRLPREGARKG